MAVHHQRIEEHPGVGRLGRHIEWDDRSRTYSYTLTMRTYQKVMWARNGRVLNQGQLGSCTGNAIAGAVNTDPLYKESALAKPLREPDAVKAYSLATSLDAYPGSYPPDDTGSSGLAACKAAKQLGWIGSYLHAFGIDSALAALQHGPVITGVAWYEGFDHPDANGMVSISGQVRGGHEFLVKGFDPSDNIVTAQNSWGYTWGLKGLFRFTARTWSELLAQQGDVTVPVGRT